MSTITDIDHIAGGDLRPLLALFPHRYPSEVAVTAFSGIEYTLDDQGRFVFAMASVDGTDLDERDFLTRLQGLPYNQVLPDNAAAADAGIRARLAVLGAPVVRPDLPTEDAVALYVLDGYVHYDQPCSDLFVEWQAGLGNYDDPNFDEVWEDLVEEGCSTVEKWQTEPSVDDEFGEYHDLTGETCQVCGHAMTSPPPPDLVARLGASERAAREAGATPAVEQALDPSIATDAMRDILVRRLEG